MQFRSIALAGMALAALSVTPALAGDATGWYLGLGAGYDHMDPIHVVTAPPISATSRLGQQDMAMVAGGFGYKWASGLRLEFEVGYSSHDQHAHNPPFAGTLSGSSTLKSALVNFVYDMNLGGNWGLELGGGVGAGALNMSIRDSFFPALKLIRGQHTEFMWQGIIGLNYQTSDNVEWYLDYRYRSAEIDRGYASDFLALTPIHVAQAEEHVAMVGIRWYLNEPVEKCPDGTDKPCRVLCPDGKHYEPCPPIVDVAPVNRTFIIYFDTAKAIIREDMLTVVQAAVRTAKVDGYVKVRIVGHTDTVGKNDYNMDLSKRRAESVRNKMIEFGLAADTIDIDWKGFHQLKVDTLPGVAEPMNRRATIDVDNPTPPYGK